MNCPNCGADLPEGSTFCANCGSSIGDQQQGYANPNDALFNQAPAGGAFDSSNYGAAPAKKKTGLIVGIIAAVVAVIAIVLVLVLFVFKGNTDGRYVCDTFAAFGIDFYLDVDGSNFDMVMEAYGEKETESGTIKFSGSTVTMTVDGETITGEYDKKEGTITFKDDDFGMELTFTKE